jgi:hypothetical protein
MIGSDTHTAYHPLWLSRHYCPIEKSLSSLLLTITLAAHNNISAAKFLEHAACLPARTYRAHFDLCVGDLRNFCLVPHK